MLFELVVFVGWTFGWRQAHRIHGVTLDEAPSCEDAQVFSWLALPWVVESVAQSGAQAVLVLASASLGSHSVASVAVLNSLKSLAASAFVGSALQVRIAKLMVEDPVYAKGVFWGVFAALLTSCSLFCIALTICRQRLAGVYSADGAVASLIVDFMPIMLMDLLLGVAVSMLQNGLAALGKTDQFALAKLFAMGVKVPAGLYLMLCCPSTRGVLGYWLGVLLGDVAQLCLMLFFFLRVDWGEQSDVARARSQ